MASKKQITSQDVVNLVQAKAQDPRISMADLFSSVDNVKPNVNKEFWRLFWIPLLFYLASIVGMLFLEINSRWNRLSIIIFLLSTVGGLFVLKKYEKKWWWIIIVDIVIVFLIFSEAVTMEGIIKLLQVVF